MRWLLLKDLQILRRSPLLVGLLIAYPVLVALLLGLALSSGPSKPRVAFANLAADTDTSFVVDGQRRDAASYADRLFRAVDPIRVDSRAAAIAKVRDGDALAALIIPADIAQRLQQTLSLSGSPQRPTVEVVYNGADPIKRQFVESTIESRLADANQALSGELVGVARTYLDVLLKGGSFSILGRQIDVLGLQRSSAIIKAAIASLPPDSRARAPLTQVVRFADLAIENLGFSDTVLKSVTSPIAVDTIVLADSRTPLDAYAVAAAVTVSLMFVCLLLAAGMLALEREEHAFSRLVRGLVGRTALLAEKAGLAALGGLLVTLIMLAGAGAFIGLAFERAPLWALVLAVGGIAFGAMGVAIGALAREVRAASLLVLLLGLPVAAVALVPDGTLSGAVATVVDVVSAIFPFRATLRGMQAALEAGSGSLLGPLAHLAGLAVAFLVIARIGLRRFVA